MSKPNVVTHMIPLLQDINGKEVQISLTGFMEKNTGKFMKELWALLLSAEKNTSGVPQQFLDAKEDDTRRKKVRFLLVFIFFNYRVACVLCIHVLQIFDRG